MTPDDFPLYHYRGVVERVIDADTFVVDIDLGFRTFVRKHVRLARFDAAEDETERGKEAALAVRQLIDGREVFVLTLRDRMNFERVIGEVWIEEADGLTNLSDMLEAAGWAKNAVIVGDAGFVS